MAVKISISGGEGDILARRGLRPPGLRSSQKLVKVR